MALVAASGNGAAPSTAANRKNNGATVLHGGNVDTTGPITRDLSLSETTDGNSIGTSHSKITEIGGSGASTTDRRGITKAVSAGTLAFTPSSTQWLMVGGNVATTIGGVANTVLVGGNTDFDGQATTRDNIHQTVSTYMLGSGNGTFDVYAIPSTENTPGYTKGGDAGSKRFFVAPSGAGDVTATDDAAVPTRSVPGELTYLQGGKDPVTDEYKASNVFES
jgi:hypothetical protein